MSTESPRRSPLNRFHVCKVFANDTGQTLATLLPTTTISLPPHHPFSNESTFEFIKQCCLSRSSQTLQGSTDMAMLIASGRVVPEELKGFNARTELQRLDKFADTSPFGGGPWRLDSVKIKMPCTKGNNPGFSGESDAPDFEVHGIRYRSLVSLLTSHIQDPSTSNACVYTPFTEWWVPPGTETPIRIYGEAYSSDIAVRLYEEVKQKPPPPDHPNIESVIALLLLGSDATHLADFGTASLWPIYATFGNMSKYDRSKPSKCPVAHLAYLPKVMRHHAH